MEEDGPGEGVTDEGRLDERVMEGGGRGLVEVVMEEGGRRRGERVMVEDGRGLVEVVIEEDGCCRGEGVMV